MWSSVLLPSNLFRVTVRMEAEFAADCQWMVIAEVQSLLEEVEDSMEGIEALVSPAAITPSTLSSARSSAGNRRFSVARMLRRDEAFDPPVCHIGVGCDNRGSSEDIQELRLAVGRLETELKSFPRSLHSPDTQDRGVGDLFVSTRDESTAMTARRLDNNGSTCVSEMTLGTSDKWDDERLPFEGVSSESISAIAMDTGPSSTGRMQPMESNRAGRRRDAIRSVEEHWELLMRSAEASRRDLRSRAVAASRGQPMTPEASEARRYSSPILAERESFAVRTDGNESEGRSSPGYRSISLPHVMSSRTRSAPFAQYHNIAFDGSKGSTEALRKWLFGE
ncbi:hypothetical protein FOZ63_025307 [Perkinsus olseni]|uniref:Uncharacterized protein n=1 Tax=Perkinsus olseni TaxID=32597 RepID=A0A7J6U2W8_PEROL|nr:hypothetical protein FOZ63_025307 [Perkinsus olseni]KAF4751745.1 hypothetical protein FOZ62_026576 [Perkinsus olseni]